MILGDICTRSCGYCNVNHGRPNPVDTTEPNRLAIAVKQLGLRHVVITSVDRDDLSDGGASIFTATIEAIRRQTTNCSIEVLIPDFSGRSTDLCAVLNARPDVLNHNIETVERLYRFARPAGRYRRALELFERVNQYTPSITTKSGLMVGLGEQWHEVLTTLRDLRRVGCELLTIGQYLRPSVAHLPLARYYDPSEFEKLKEFALRIGFGHVESGPLVRSSYHAYEQLTAVSTNVLRL
jgi:lipoic acid synthetase